MKIAVCLKLVPATTADLRVSPDGQSLQLSGVETIVSPYDEFALEAALKVKESVPGSSVHAISAGPDEALKCLQHAFSVGGDAGTHIKGTFDAHTAARLIAAVLGEIAADVIFCGRQAIDDDQWLVPGALGELLNIPHVTAVSSLNLGPEKTSFECRRRFEGGEQVIQLQLPAIISCDKGLNEPRAPTLKGRLDAKKKQPVVKTAAELGVAEAELAPALTITRYSPPPQKNAGKIISSPPAEAARELVRLLREEAKII
ncbi:MAG TPA: electron transfer flavoprotein subunit beta/FixA family protein [Planctomycetota bacterium]|nr:electron transfer flavoprotein subunit beta/FixA family protein [Planctomycetota bacterium]